jgi:hypothetical protein
MARPCNCLVIAAAGPSPVLAPQLGLSPRARSAHWQGFTQKRDPAAHPARSLCQIHRLETVSTSLHAGIGVSILLDSIFRTCDFAESPADDALKERNADDQSAH